jgi:acetyl esterase/lipase
MIPRMLGSMSGVIRCALAVLLLASVGCTRFQLLDATIPSCSYTLTKNLRYGNNPRQKLDMYVPRDLGDKTADVVVFFYGGDWQSGEKGDYRFVGEALASRGFVAVLPDYRLYPEVTFPGFVEDGARAVRWVRDNVESFGGDPHHIFLMGHSAGAHIAMLLTLDKHYLNDAGSDPSEICATAGLSGPYDFQPPPEDVAALGAKPGETKVRPNVEPIHFVDGKEPPVLLIQGLKDTTVGPENAINLTAAIRAKGGYVELITYPDRAHVGVVQSLAWSFRWLAPTLEDVSRFFNQVSRAARVKKE